MHNNIKKYKFHRFDVVLIASAIFERTMIIFSKPTVVVTYDKDRAVLFIKWIGYTPGEDFRSAIDTSFEFMSKENIYRILSDIKEQRVVSPHEQDYTKNAVLKFYTSNDLLKIAFITNPKSVAAACFHRYNKAVVGEISADINKFFSCEEDALSWLSTNSEKVM